MKGLTNAQSVMIRSNEKIIWEDIWSRSTQKIEICTNVPCWTKQGVLHLFQTRTNLQSISLETLANNNSWFRRSLRSCESKCLTKRAILALTIAAEYSTKRSIWPATWSELKKPKRFAQWNLNKPIRSHKCSFLAKILWIKVSKLKTRVQGSTESLISIRNWIITQNLRH